jgi:hypothetical protein
MNTGAEEAKFLGTIVRQQQANIRRLYVSLCTNLYSEQIRVTVKIACSYGLQVLNEFNSQFKLSVY